MLKTIEMAVPESDRNKFKGDTESVLQRMNDYQWRGQSAVIFCDVSENFWRIYDLMPGERSMLVGRDAARAALARADR
jgi:hypothetical protein